MLRILAVSCISIPKPPAILSRMGYPGGNARLYNRFSVILKYAMVSARKPMPSHVAIKIADREMVMSIAGGVMG